MSKLLRKQFLLEDLTDGELSRMSVLVKRLDFGKGEIIFREREDTKGLYLIHSGRVEISKRTPDGWKQTLAALSKGNFFGELSILERRRHEASAVAVENTSILLIGKREFERIGREEPVIALKILRKMTLVMSKNLRRMNDRFLNALISY